MFFLQNHMSSCLVRSAETHHGISSGTQIQGAALCLRIQAAPCQKTRQEPVDYRKPLEQESRENKESDVTRGRTGMTRITDSGGHKGWSTNRSIQ